MKTRIFCVLLALTFALAGLSACGTADTAADTTVPVAAEEDGQNPVMNFVGNYQCDRCMMLVEAQGMDGAKITVHWGSDVWTYAEWVLTGTIAEEGKGLVMRYTDGAYAVVKADEFGNESRSDETAGLTGTVLFNSDNTITWTDDHDGQIQGLVFEWAPVISEEEPYEESVEESVTE